MIRRTERHNAKLKKRLFDMEIQLFRVTLGPLSPKTRRRSRRNSADAEDGAGRWCGKRLRRSPAVTTTGRSSSAPPTSQRPHRQPTADKAEAGEISPDVTGKVLLLGLKRTSDKVKHSAVLAALSAQHVPTHL